LGLGVITGAADGDPSAIGTYASAGAAYGTGLPWMAPLTFPMMFVVVYLSAKLGQVTGNHYPRWLLWPTLIGVLAGNVIEAAADIGGMAAAIGLVIPLPAWVITTTVACSILAVQIFAPYATIRNIFRWLALALLAYVGAAILAKPDIGEVLYGTFVPKFEFTKEYLSMVVAIIGTTLSAYLYTWQSNMEVEEEIAKGRTRVEDRQGASRKELARTRRDVWIGMGFSNVIMFFVILATSATLHKAGQHDIESAAQAAEALKPIAGPAAGWLFTLGIIGVGFLAVPVMTTGAAYDLAQALGWRHSLNAKPQDAKRFYLAIAGFTAIALGMNFLGFNPMKALVWSGIVQGFSTPPLLVMILLMTQ
jgi:Mn2+/Fe2+ NRAMP family transporter